MGKQTRRKNRLKIKLVKPKPLDEADLSCPVCFEAFVDSSIKSKRHLFDNAVQCGNKHSTCMDCVVRILQFSSCSSASCSQMSFVCPTCRDDSCMDKMEFLAVTKRSWKRSMEPFRCGHQVDDYMGE